ncbi:4-methyl-5(b-hydroxyethyl)-thiazole monophosphate biosynthesis [Strigomonas culicis]|uniref:4-methyl-5(B-hydroxyethyl)-thiazole monophosphate biosynthesis n=1 Tax=Strigomonas culicis TaxID=28005 RepID=S9UGA9_9TRYP|nr:4-methyl-5(b-hydroxyethyl)-thiazole monophosphate biosynthesis [Strigomonas culicis]EPY34347.1 4-methyl-5(b-hydroxyethyl)-thiazole monophosphate biosynthesis [Strigomonas culicis]|eukprot:EPY27784.1 4-methyl-5(b-hydroxyethyl)-thiazole monophosphate biosynthesis [Strigomonas culicis]
MSKHVLVPVADGSEDIEFSAITDVLHRAELNVTVASVMGRKNVTLAHGLKLESDSLIGEESASKYDGVFLAGGFDGSNHFGKSEELKKFMHEMRDQKKLFGAICAAPVLSLGPLGMLEGVQRATCYPSMESMFPPTVKPSTDVVVKCGQCLTSRGPGTAIFFALAAVSVLRGKDVASAIAKALLVDHFPEAQLAISIA